MTDLGQQPEEVIVATANIIDSAMENTLNFDEMKKFVALEMRKQGAVNDKGADLSSDELEQAMKKIVRQVQTEEFALELNILRKNKTVPKSNSLIALSPFLDEDGIIRVGGRLSRADIPYDAKPNGLQTYKWFVFSIQCPY